MTISLTFVNKEAAYGIFREALQLGNYSLSFNIEGIKGREWPRLNKAWEATIEDIQKNAGVYFTHETDLPTDQRLLLEAKHLLLAKMTLYQVENPDKYLNKITIEETAA